MSAGLIRVGAVAYDPKVVTIWEGMRDYFREAGGSIPLPARDEGNTVKLMTVHGAKGLELDHVFVLRAVSNSFPASYREPLIEFPPALRSLSCR